MYMMYFDCKHIFNSFSISDISITFSFIWYLNLFFNIEPIISNV